MKKLIILLAILISGNAFAAGTCTITPEWSYLRGIKTGVVQVLVSCTADASAATFPDTTISDVGGNLQAVYVNPGTVTVPTTAFDLTAELDSTGIDLLGGAGADIDSSADALITPLVGTPSAPAGFAGDIVQKITNNSVNSATVDIYYIFSY